MPTYVFPDTNVFLHFRRPDEIDWRGLVGSDEVELVIVLPVIRELDKLKATIAVRRLRERAAGAVRWLAAMAASEGPTSIRDGVTLSFRRSDPVIDFRFHRLREGIVDDEVVGSVLEFKAEHEGSPVLIVTGDLGMRVLAPGHGLETVAPPEESKLPDEPDPAETEARKLRLQLAEFQSRQPDTVVVFRDGTSRTRVVLPVVDQVSDLAVRRAVEEARWAAEHERPLMLGDEDDDAGFGYTRDQALEYVMHRCNAKHEYMIALQAARSLRGRSIDLALLLENRGKAMATDIDVEFEVSDGRAVFSESHGPDPKDPFAGVPDPAPNPRAEAPAARSLEVIDELAPAHLTTTVVRYHCASLKPARSVRLAPLVVTFAIREQVETFALHYKVSHADGPGLELGRLDVVVAVE